MISRELDRLTISYNQFEIHDHIEPDNFWSYKTLLNTSTLLLCEHAGIFTY